jgi:hypothetical protein
VDNKSHTFLYAPPPQQQSSTVNKGAVVMKLSHFVVPLLWIIVFILGLNYLETETPAAVVSLLADLNMGG